MILRNIRLFRQSFFSILRLEVIFNVDNISDFRQYKNDKKRRFLKYHLGHFHDIIYSFSIFIHVKNNDK